MIRRSTEIDDERIALFLDYENLAIGAREGLGVEPFDFGPIADALAERGRVVTRRAYADWSYFDEGRRLLAHAQVELIEIPQRLGVGRKNAADIKLAVDAIELAYERDFITTFAIGTGDSDFTPLVHKLRELDKRVIGIGVQSSTSALLPPACDEFLFYDRLPGVEAVPRPAPSRRRPAGRAEPAAATGRLEPGKAEAGPPGAGQPRAAAQAGRPAAEPTGPEKPGVDEAGHGEAVEEEPVPPEEQEVGPLVARTLAGLQRTSDGPVLSSRLKRAILRKDPTFDESAYGFRSFGELLRHLQSQGVVVLGEGLAKGDPQVTFPEAGPEDQAFQLLVDVVRELGEPQLSGLKNQIRKKQPDFSEKRFGFNSFLSFVRAARARDLIDMRRDDELGDYVLSVPAGT